MRRAWLLRCAFLVLALFQAPVAAETRLSLPQARQFAVQLVQSGQPLAARAAALALLRHDPNDVVALIVLSRAARDLGDYRPAEAAARRAFRIAQTDKDRFSAALAMAQALASHGRHGAAQLWLRRAAEVAPDARHRMVAVRDFAYVKSRNPWRATFDFGAFPSSNVNDGPVTNTIVIGGIEFSNPDAVPLSGFGLSAAADLQRHWELGPTSRIVLGLAGNVTEYRLSDAARAAVPSARASDFGKAGLSASIGWARQDGPTQLSVTVQGGRDWQAGATLADWRQLRLGYGRAFAEDRRLNLGFSLTDTDRHDAALRSSLRSAVDLGWSWGAPGADGWALGLSIGRVASDAASVARREAELRLDWQDAQPLLGAELSAFASIGLKLYDRPLYIADARRDVTAQLGLSAVLVKLDYLGFAPEVGVTFSQTDSNITAMTTRKAELRLGVKSTF